MKKLSKAKKNLRKYERIQISRVTRREQKQRKADQENSCHGCGNYFCSCHE